MTQPTIGGSGGPAVTSKRYEELLTEFGRGWEAARPSTMASVFTDDAVFVPGAFSGQVRGRDAIAAYWSDVPSEQSAISFRLGEIFVAGPWFASEFTCTFRRIRTGEWIQVSGALFCETAGDKISEMRMYWDRSAVQAPQ
jgi:ketosteroid isomerase-like protein